MTTDPSAPASEISYAIAFPKAVMRTGYNLDFKGSGTLTIRPEGSSYVAYVFSGRPQRLLARQTTELILAASEISNVTISGRTISFRTPQGRSGQRKLPFIFLCRDEAEAQTVASLLPAHMDADFIAEYNFKEQLRAMPGPSTPWASVTNQLIAANVIVFVIMAGLLGAGWVEATNIMPYIRYGANNGAATTDGEWWRLVTCMFMHFGIMHLAFNMWALYQVGHLVEKLFGRLLYTLAYFGSGIFASLASIAWHGDKMWSAGASGAIFGIYGALLGYMLREKHALPRNVFSPLLRSTLFFAGYNIVYGMVHPEIDSAAHIGGFVSGFGLGWLTALPIDPARRLELLRPRFLLGLTAVCVSTGLGMAYTPRFDYSLRDEIAWQDSFHGVDQKEPALLKSNDEQFAQYQASDQTRADYAHWITTELIPFYAQLQQKLAALKLEPGKITEKRRTAVLQMLQTKLAGYQHLLKGVQENDPQEIARYVESERDVQQQMAGIAK
ncbi:MAG TPA: rhomboid family intramembrane serine protease [Opitutaceae bacterium]|nr:rhomboid family intramembrane serine protease [Opitutaceae bacterium]